MESGAPKGIKNDRKEAVKELLKDFLVAVTSGLIAAELYNLIRG